MPIKHFSEIDPQKLESYYSKEILVDELRVELDLNFEVETLSQEELAQLNKALDQLPSVIKKSWEWILEDLKKGVEVSEYISYHLDDFFEDDPEVILKGTDPKLDNEDRFLKTMRVNRVGVYPTSKDNYLILDWMTDPELSNYILAVYVNEELNLKYITVES